MTCLNKKTLITSTNSSMVLKITATTVLHIWRGVPPHPSIVSLQLGGNKLASLMPWSLQATHLPNYYT
jgi:hypothetical protein